MKTESYHLKDLQITLNKKGAREYSKVSYPLRYGRFTEVRTPGYLYQFDLNGEIKFISGLGEDWPDPSERLKRTVANDWVYYSTGGYSGVYDTFGEHYIPCLSYPNNSIHFMNPFKDRAVGKALDSWTGLYRKIKSLYSDFLPEDIRSFFVQVLKRSPESLRERPQHLHEIIRGPVPVLPPDTRHVDYEVIPIIAADGCLYRCDFCVVKTNREFQCRSQEDIQAQVKDLKAFYARDILNHNSIFLAQNDVLHAGIDLIEFAARHAYEEFDFKHSHMRGPCLFLFGSVDSFIRSDYNLFERLERLPFFTCINIGLESADPETLHRLGKPVSFGAVDEAFARMLEINRKFEKIEITANFVFGRDLPGGHVSSFYGLMEKHVDSRLSKGTVYFSPLINGREEDRRGLKREFYKLKMRSRLPTYLYLIQRL